MDETLEIVEINDAAEKDRKQILENYNSFLSRTFASLFNSFSINHSKKLLDEISTYAIVPSMIGFYRANGKDIQIALKLFGSEVRIVFSHRHYYEIEFESYRPAFTEYKKYSKYEYEKFKNYIIDQISLNLIQPDHFVKKATSYVFLKRDNDAAILMTQYINFLSKHAKIVGYKDSRYDRSEYLNRFSREICRHYKTYAIFKNEKKAGFFTVGIDDRFRNPHLLKDEVIFHFYKLRDNTDWPNDYRKKEAIKIKSMKEVREIVDWFNS